MKKTIFAVAVVALIAIGIAISAVRNSPAPIPASAANPVPAVPKVATPGVKSFTVIGANFSFSPSTITVKKGDAVNITFRNSDGFHDFVIDELNVATQRIRSGEQDVVTFVADKTGSFEYYCSVGSHRAMGMRGTLVVQ